MPEIDLMRVDHCVSDVKLDDSSSSPPGFFDGGGVPLDSDVKLDEEDSDSLKKRGRRGRPPRILAKASSPPISRKRREDEDVCFVCFDGGSLVLCDRRGCPKAYHPACVKRTEAFFRSRSKWNCGWHICTTCQKDSFYMCYTCPYSVCKRCVRSSEYVVVRENKGFCGICMKTIMLIENAAEANKEKVQVDFDDQGSWEYLFKIYWVSLKEKLGLSLDDLTKAKNPWKSSSSTAAKRRTTSRVHEKDDGNSPGVMKIRRAKVRKMDAVSVSNLGPSLDSNCSLGDRLPQLTSAATWATNELLDFVGYMKNGDISVLSKYDVQTLVLEYVRRNNLQNSPQNSEIMCDSKLMRLFGKERVDNLEMLKLLDSHFIDQVRSPVTDNSAGGVTETMSYQVNAGRSCDRLNTSEQHQEGESQQLNGHSIQVRPSSSDSRNHAVVKPDTSATLSNKPIDGLDTNMVWLYGDPDGKIHGPFSLYNLRQWNSSGHFPPELRIWRLGEQQHSSILLTDALNGQFHKTGLLQNHSIPKQEVTATIANDQNRSVAVPKIESRILDFSPNSVCTDQSVISSSNSVITRSSGPEGMAISEEEAKLERFLDWLQVNGGELRGCNIKYSDSLKGFGIFASTSTQASDEVLLVVPLDLAITPMRVLQDPLLGPECQKMFEQGQVDDRFLMILFLTLERLRINSSWKPYLDMLPTRFGNPLWFSDDDILELKGTNLYHATELQKKKLLSLYHDKVEVLVTKLLILDGDSESKVSFEHFLWANSVFWSRALNIPLPHSFVFPQSQDDTGECTSTSESPETAPVNSNEEKEIQAQPAPSVGSGDTIWVEGLVPGIDFCNHDLKPVATWEVDGIGSVSRVPFSMYLLSVAQRPIPKKEISISYGNKGNEELLYLYGFVIDNNPDDYLMVHYPVEAIPSIPFSDSKGQLLEAQNAQLRCLLPKSVLNHGFFPRTTSVIRESDEKETVRSCNFSWSGKRKMPTYMNKLVFPEDFMTGLRTIAMQEEEIYKVSAMLEELVESRQGEQPSETEVRMAVWEACGDSGALQLLVDLLNSKMMKLEENSGTEEQDARLLEEACVLESHEESRDLDGRRMSRNKWSSVVYRRGQKQLTRLLLKEAEHALHLALSSDH